MIITAKAAVVVTVTMQLSNEEALEIQALVQNRMASTESPVVENFRTNLFHALEKQTR